MTGIARTFLSYSNTEPIDTRLNKVANTFQVSILKVLEELVNNGIQVANKRVIWYLTEDYLKDKIAQDYQVKDIANRLGCSRQVIDCALNKYNLIYPAKARLLDIKAKQKLSLSNAMLGFMVGTLLGDSWFHYTRNKSSNCLAMAHSIKQKGYLEYKANVLRAIIGMKPWAYSTKDQNGNNVDMLSIQTFSHPDIKWLHMLMWPKDRKTVTKEVIELLTVFGLAVWYMDDGSVSHDSYYLWTLGYTLEENKLLREYLHRKFDIKTSILNFKQNTQYYLRIAKDSIYTFEKLIGPFIAGIDCLKHKYKGFKIKHPQRADFEDWEDLTFSQLRCAPNSIEI